MIEGELYHDQIVWMLKDAVRKHGSQKALAKQIGISTQFLNDMVHERKAVTGKALDFLGLYPLTIYRRMGNGAVKETI